jgi:hypothetical protein
VRKEIDRKRETWGLNGGVAISYLISSHISICSNDQQTPLCCSRKLLTRVVSRSGDGHRRESTIRPDHTLHQSLDSMRLYSRIKSSSSIDCLDVSAVSCQEAEMNISCESAAQMCQVGKMADIAMQRSIKKMFIEYYARTHVLVMIYRCKS